MSSTERENRSLFLSTRRGVCAELQEMGREELLADYLTPLKFQHDGPGTRSLGSFRGGKARHDWSGKLSGASLGLYSVLAVPGNSTVSVGQVSSGTGAAEQQAGN